eukprot:7596279-Pyramimonas_sp.AAC.1
MHLCDSGETPKSLGLKDYGNFSSLGLCPKTPNCISTAEEANDQAHFVPAWCDPETFPLKSRASCA